MSEGIPKLDVSERRAWRQYARAALSGIANNDLSYSAPAMSTEADVAAKYADLMVAEERTRFDTNEDV